MSPPCIVYDTSPDTTMEDLTRQYRGLALKHHPDKNPGDDTANSRMVEVQTEYERAQEKLKSRQPPAAHVVQTPPARSSAKKPSTSTPQAAAAAEEEEEERPKYSWEGADYDKPHHVSAKVRESPAYQARSNVYAKLRAAREAAARPRVYRDPYKDIDLERGLKLCIQLLASAVAARGRVEGLAERYKPVHLQEQLDLVKTVQIKLSELVERAMCWKNVLRSNFNEHRLQAGPSTKDLALHDPTLLRGCLVPAHIALSELTQDLRRLVNWLEADGNRFYSKEDYEWDHELYKLIKLAQLARKI